MDYRVELDTFSGPLDLLLYLVRRQEVDVVDLPIAEITAKFVEFLEVLQFLDFDLIGDFVVMAASKEKKLISETNLGSAVYGTPIVANGVIYVQSNTHLFAFANSAKNLKDEPQKIEIKPEK